MVEALEALGSLFFVIWVMSVPLAFFMIWMGAKMAGARDLIFWRLAFASALSSAVIHGLTLIFYAIPDMISTVGFFLGLVLSLFVIKHTLGISFKQTILPWLLNILAQITAILAGALLFVGGTKEFIEMVM